MAKGEAFELTVRVEIVKVSVDGNYTGRTGERLSIDETLPIGVTASFAEAAQILARFHELARTLSERSLGGVGAG